MLQQRKKDYLQRIIEEFFKKMAALLEMKEDSTEAKKLLLGDCFNFFLTNFEVNENDSVELLASKIQDFELSQQYARLLLTQYQITDTKNKEQLLKALHLIEFLQETDSTYSWSRVMLREELLAELDETTILSKKQK